MSDLIVISETPAKRVRAPRGKHVKALLVAMGSASEVYRLASHPSRAQLAKMLTRCAAVVAQAKPKRAIHR